MTAYLLGLILDFAVDGMLVSLHKGGTHVIRNEAVRIDLCTLGQDVGTDLPRHECEALDRILVGKALGSGQLIESVVGTRRVDVVLDLDSLTLLGLYQSYGMVAVCELRRTHLLLSLGKSVHRL